MKVISIIVPSYNEAKTLPALLQQLADPEVAKGLQKEVIIVDDASSDDTKTAVDTWNRSGNASDIQIRYHRHKSNKGKGACIQTGIALCSGNYVLIQDADLEYNPRDINALLQPVLEGHADVVFGSRFISQNPHRVLYFWHSVGNKLLTTLSNMFSNLNLTDMETGYKLFRSEVIRQITLKEKRFGVEPELTAKVAKVAGVRIYEVGISYFGRTYKEGKKVNWKDGVWALYCILRYNLLN